MKDFFENLNANMEAEYRRIIAAANEGMWAMDAHYRTTFVNERLTELLGYRAEEMLGRPVTDFMFPEDLEEHRARMARRRLGEAGIYEQKFRRKDGSACWLQVSATSLRDEHGQFAGSFAMFMDINPRRQAEEQLEKMEETIRLLYETTHLGIITTNEKGVMIAANAAVEKILGLNKEHILGKDALRLPWQVIQEDGSPFPEEDLPAAVALRTGKEIRNVLMGVVNPHDHQLRWLNVSAFPQFLKEKEHPSLVYTFIEDVTESRKVRQAEKKFYQELEAVNRVVAQLIELVDENEVYNIICQAVHALIPEALVVISAMEPDRNHLRIVKLLGFEKQIEAVKTILKKDPLEMKFPVKAITEHELAQYRSGKLVQVEKGLYQLAMRKIPLPICKLIEQILGLGEIHTIGFAWGGLHYGGLTLLMPVGKKMEYAHLIETIVHQASIAIQRIRAEKALRENEQRYRELFDNMNDGVAVYSTPDEGKTFIIRDFNHGAEKIENIRREDILGKNVKDVFPGVEQFGIFEAFQRVWRTGLPEHFPIKFYRDQRMQGWRENYIYKLPSGEVVAVYSDETQRRQAEDKLRESEERYRHLFELESDAIFLIDNETGRILEANTAASQLYGYSREELLSMRNVDLSAQPEETQNVTQSTPIIKENLVTIPLRLHRRKDGQILQVEITGRFFLLHDRPVHIAAIRDISQRIQAENELKQAQAILEEAQSIAHIGSYEVILPEKRVVWSKELYRIFGWDPQTSQATIDAYYASIHPEDRERVEQAGKQWDKPDAPVEIDYRIIRPDGSLRHVIERYRAYADETGKVIRFVGTIQDTTESWLVAQALGESEARFQRLVENAPDSIFVQTENRFLYLNPAAVKLFGAQSAEELLGKSVLDFFHPSFHKVIVERVKTIHEQKKAVPNLEEIAVRLDGSLVDVETSAVPIRYQDKDGALVFVRDISERKKLERTLVEREKLAGIGTLAAGIAHEINTPLQIITGISESAQRKLEEAGQANPDDLLRRFRTINSNAWRIAAIVRSLLDYSRSSAEKAEICSINELVQKTLLLVEHQLKSWANISVVTYLQDDLPSVYCDSNQISQVLINLINNASDAMPNGGRITIETSFDPAAQSIVIRVGDTGKGIPEEIRGKIFDPFFTTKPIGKGTGLGLSIISGILHAHGGLIELERTSSEGTVFKVSLPIDNLPATADQDQLGRY